MWNPRMNWRFIAGKIIEPNGRCSHHDDVNWQRDPQLPPATIGDRAKTDADLCLGRPRNDRLFLPILDHLGQNAFRFRTQAQLDAFTSCSLRQLHVRAASKVQESLASFLQLLCDGKTLQNQRCRVVGLHPEVAIPGNQLDLSQPLHQEPCWLGFGKHFLLDRIWAGTGCCGVRPAFCLNGRRGWSCWHCCWLGLARDFRPLWTRNGYHFEKNPSFLLKTQGTSQICSVIPCIVSS